MRSSVALPSTRFDSSTHVSIGSRIERARRHGCEVQRVSRRATRFGNRHSTAKRALSSLERKRARRPLAPPSPSVFAPACAVRVAEVTLDRDRSRRAAREGGAPSAIRGASFRTTPQPLGLSAHLRALGAENATGSFERVQQIRDVDTFARTSMPRARRSRDRRTAVEPLRDRAAASGRAPSRAREPAETHESRSEPPRRLPSPGSTCLERPWSPTHRAHAVESACRS